MSAGSAIQPEREWYNAIPVDLPFDSESACMNSGLQTARTISHSVGQPLLAQFGGSKSYWVDLVIIAVLIGLVVFVVGRSSRRY